MPTAVAVPCSCPGTPHETDSVSLLDKISVPMAVAALEAVPAGTRLVDVSAFVTPVYMRFGIVDWTFTDENGEALPVTPENIEARLTWANGAFEVADAAAELYTAELLAPLARRLRGLSPTTSTDDSTSVTPQSGAPTATSSASSSPKHTGGKRSGAKGR